MSRNASLLELAPRVLGLTLALLLGAGSAGAALGLAEAATSGQFRVEGKSILDPQGKEFVVRGVNVNGPYWPWNHPTAPDVRLISDVWKFNTVRVCCFPRLVHNGVGENQDLDELVRVFTGRKVVVMIENHDVTGRYPEAGVVQEGETRYPSIGEMTQWWTDIAQRYRNNPYVWFNTMNEPGKGGLTSTKSAAKWREVNEQFIKAIRATGAQNIVVLDGHDWGQEGGYNNPSSDSAIISEGPALAAAYPNIVFSLHMYGMWAEGESRLRQYIADAQAKGLPLIVGEYGAGDSGTTTGSAAMFNVAVPANVGRIVWSWDSQDEYDLTRGTQFGAGWEVDRTDGTKPTNLNWLGDLIWNDNHGVLQLPVTAVVPLLANGNFEKGLDGWMNWGRAEVSTVAHSGEKALRVTAGDQGGGGQTIVGVKPNTKYKLTVWGKVSDKLKGGSADVGFQYKPSSDAPDSKQVQYIVTFTKTEWTRKEVAFTTGPLVAPGPNIFVWKSAKNVDLFIDDVTLEQI